MTEKEKKKESGGISRREFLRDAGLVVGGAAIGSTALLAACSGEEKVTTKTVTTTLPGTTVTVTAGPGEAVPGIVTLTVNGMDYTLKVEPEWPLSFVLREKLGLVGTKVGCDRGECGSCTIIVDGRPVLACTMLAIESGGKDILTIEGLSDGSTLHPVQQLFLENCAFQCGFCTPGHIMSTVALLDKNPSPTRDEVKEAISGNLCFCSDYTRVIDTILKGGQ